MSIICPHCNATKGFYTKETVTGTATVYYNEKGDYANEQSEMYSLSHKGGKLAYCVQCDKRIGKSADLISGNAEPDLPFGY